MTKEIVEILTRFFRVEGSSEIRALAERVYPGKKPGETFVQIKRSGRGFRPFGRLEIEEDLRKAGASYARAEVFSPNFYKTVISVAVATRGDLREAFLEAARAAEQSEKSLKAAEDARRAAEKAERDAEALRQEEARRVAHEKWLADPIAQERHVESLLRCMGKNMAVAARTAMLKSPSAEHYLAPLASVRTSMEDGILHTFPDALRNTFFLKAEPDMWVLTDNYGLRETGKLKEVVPVLLRKIGK